MNYSNLIEHEFRTLYGEQPLMVRSPGRVNLIGEHTDYNLGFVLPGAIDKAAYFAVAPRNDMKCSFYALDLRDKHETDLEHLEYTKKGWPNYLMGVIQQLLKGGGRLGGINCVFGGDIPIGAGVSSSAALEAGLAFALNRIFDLGLDGLSLARLAQKAENEFVGVRCGIMDQYANIFGLKGHVLRIDCRSLEHTYYPFDSDSVSIVLFDTGVSHSLASSEYNRRRAECTEGVAILRSRHPEISSLRDATPSTVDECRELLPDNIYRRCKYVVEEDERVLRACRLLQEGDLRGMGALMGKSHEGLRDLYEVSCKELDFLEQSVSTDSSVYGSRMMGGGFGGCTINIVENSSVAGLCAEAAERYKSQFAIDLKSYVMTIGSGTGLVGAQ
ncbi:MAG TPA: galactokinase [Bacteroidota bacterium]|nr:galactokinase [Bacteroidota bacterium]